jgi:hypothetical protein
MPTFNSGKFTFDLTNGKYKIEDITDYAGQSINPAHVAVVFTIVSPSGITVHTNPDYDNPDIAPDDSLEFDTVTLPTDAGGNVLQGLHTITMKTRYDNTVDPEEFSEQAYTLNFQFAEPELEQNVVIDYYSPMISSTDITNYLVNGVQPNMPITRDHRIIYPPTSNASPTVSTGATVQSQTFYSQDGGLQHTFRLTSTLVYYYNTGSALTSFYVELELTNDVVKMIETPEDVCNIYCALKAAKKRWENAKCQTARDIIPAAQEFFAMSALAQMIQFAYRCGKINDIAGYTDLIFKIGNATDECCCGSDTPAVVIGIGGFGSATIVEAGTGINVIFDGTDTYTVSIDPSILTMLGVEYSITSSDNSLTITSATDLNGNVIFNLVATNPLQMLTVRPWLLFSPVALPSVVAGTVAHQKRYGTVFSAPVNTPGSEFIIIDPTITDLTGYLNTPVQFQVQNFVSAGQLPLMFFPLVEIIAYNNQNTVVPTSFYDMRAEVVGVDNATGRFWFRVVRGDGTLVTGAGLWPNNIILTFKITITA